MDLRTFIPCDFMEIEEITLKLKKNTPTTFLSSQINEGVHSIVHSVALNLLNKGFKVLVVDLNNLIKEGEKHEWHNPFSEVLFKTSDNEFQTRTKKVMNGELTLSHFKSNTISSEEKEGVAQQLKKYIDSKQEDYDYILIKTVPLLEVDKNNLRTCDLTLISSEYIFVMKSNKTSGAKMTDVKEILDDAGIVISGVCVNDHMFPSLFEEIYETIEYWGIIPEKWLLKIREMFYDYRYLSKF